MKPEQIMSLSEYHRLPQESDNSDFYKRLLEVVCNNATLALFIMDEHQQCVYMNPAAEALTGYRLEETKGRALHDVIHHTRPDGRPYPLCECPIDRAFPQNNREQGEEVFVHKDGHFYPVAYTASPIREGERVIGTIIEVRDITEEKLAEQVREAALRREQQLRVEAEATQQRLTHLLEHMSDAFVALDRDWRIVYLNAEAERINQKLRAESLGKSHWEEWPASVGTDIEHQYRRAMAEQVPVQFEHHYYASPDRDVWLEIHAYPSEEGLSIFYRDITERKCTEAELQALNQQLTHRINELQTLFDLLPVGVAIADDPDCRTIRVNTYLADLLRVPVEANASHSAPPEERPAFRLYRDGAEIPVENLPMQYAARRNVQVRDEVVDLVHPDGTMFKLLSYCSPLLDQQGKVRGVLGAFVDITQRVLTETALRQSEERLRIALASSLITLFTQDRDLRYTWIYNPTPDFADIDLIGKQDADFLLAAEAEMLTQLKRRVLETRIGTRTEVKITREGQTFYYDLTVEPLQNADGEIGGITCAAVNVTQLKQTELALRQSETILHAFIASSPVGMAFFDRECRYVYANDALAETNGIPLSEHLGRTLRQVLPQWAPVVEPILQQVMQTKSPLLNQEVVGVTHPADLVRYGLVNYFPVCLPDGEVIGVGITSLDITGRKQVETERERLLQTLANERARFEAVLRQMPEGVMIADAETGQLVLSNEQANQILHHTYVLNHELEHYEPQVPFQAYRLNGEPYAADEYPLVRSLWRGEVIIHEEMELRYADGSCILIDTNSAPVFNHQGQIISAVTVFQDITERKRLEAELKEGNRILDALMEYIPEGITIADAPDVMIRRVSHYGLKLTGKPREALENIPASQHPQHWQIVHLDGITLATSEELPLTRATQQGEVVTNEEWLLQRADGRKIYISCNAGPIKDEAGQIIGGVIAWHDITERKQSEEALRQALQKLTFHVENTPMAVIEWDGELRISRWSGAAEQIFGWSADEVLGRFLFDLPLVFTEDVEHAAEVSRRLAEESYVVSYSRNYTKQGDVIHCEWYNSSLRDKSGRLISVLSLVLNITERIQAECDRERILQQAQAAREAAEAANRIKDEFLAVVSHELRAPLNPIVGWSKLLRSGQLDAEKADHALGVIERNAQMQAQLINDLLDVSRILRGKLSLDTKPVDLVSIIQAALETVRLAAEAKSIQIHTQLDSNIGPVYGDASRLQQVVWNLLSNAVKFTSAGGRVEVRLATDRITNATDKQTDSLSASKSAAQITVTDTGKGIAPEFLPYVFDYFRQESSATTRRFGGLGLGLAIVRYLVELHGGTVEAASPGEGQGATFTIKLPLIPYQMPVDREASPTESLQNLQGIRILVVDDDDNTREFLAVLLELHQANVIAVANADEALTTLMQFQPDILLSDIGMPDVDGYMLMRQIRALPPEQGGTIPAIALTAYAGEIDYQQAMAAGFQRHIAKPIEPQVLIQVITELRQPQCEGH